MNRDDLVMALYPSLTYDEIDWARRYRVIQDMPDQREVWAVLGIDKRNVIVRDSRPVGPEVGSSSTTVTVTAFMHLNCADDHRGEGHEENLILAALEEAATHRLIPYAAVFATKETAELWMSVGFRHPPWSPDGFLVYELTDEPWPDGEVDTRGRW